MAIALRNVVARLAARLACWRHGHRRGKRVSHNAVECPRCKATWLRAERKKAATGSVV